MSPREPTFDLGHLRTWRPPGGRVGPYTVGERLGQGGMGVVFAARDPSGRPVALKLLPAPGPEDRARFEREGQLTAALRHPHIVAVHAAGEDHGLLYLAYELVEGETLEALFRRGEREALLAALVDVARAVAHAHAHGVVHRDLKPANVLVDAAGCVRVADFGLATGAGLERLTQTGSLLGTPSYMAPEALQERPAWGPHVDVWALGVMLYQALTGRTPFRVNNLLALVAQLQAQDFPAPRELDPTIPPALEAVTLRALARDPADRQRDAGELADELEAALRGSGTAGPAPRRRLTLVLLALGALGALGAGLVALVRGGGEPAVADASPTPPPTATGAPPPPAVPRAELEARLRQGEREAAFVERFARPGVRCSRRAPTRATRVERAEAAFAWVLAHAPAESDAAARARAGLARVHAEPPPARVPDPAVEELLGAPTREKTPSQARARLVRILALDPHEARALVRLGLRDLIGPDALGGARRIVEGIALDPRLMGKRVVEAVRELGLGHAPKLGIVPTPVTLLARVSASSSEPLLRGFLCVATVTYDRSRTQDVARGIEALTRHLREHPAEVIAYELRGVLHLYAGQLEASGRDLAIALEAEPESASAHFARGLLAAARKEGDRVVVEQLSAARRLGYPSTGRERLKAFPELAPYLRRPPVARRILKALQ